MSFRQIIPELVCESTTAVLRQPLTDHYRKPIDPGQLFSVTITGYVGSKGAHFGEIINGREAQDIKNVNGGIVYDGSTMAEDGTIPDAGTIDLRLDIADNALIDQRKDYETHVWLFRWTWASGARAGDKEVSFTVANQSKIF